MTQTNDLPVPATFQSFIRPGWDGDYELVKVDSGTPVSLPYTYTASDSTRREVTYGSAPHKASSEGKIIVKPLDDDTTYGTEYYVSIAGLRWRKIDSLPTLSAEMQDWLGHIREDLAEVEDPKFNFGDLVLWRESASAEPVYAVIVGYSWEVNQQSEADENGIVYRYWHYSIQPLVHEVKPDHDYWAEEDWAWEEELTLVEAAPVE